MSGLKVCLKRQAVSSGSGVSRAFLKAQALLFGGYRDALQGHKEGEIYFCKELFLDHKSSSMRQFLQSAVHLQFFKQFIDDRLDILNKGKEPDDLFEEEIILCDSAAGKSKSYHQLVGNLKKGGGALINNMKTRANIRAKGLTKSGLKYLLINKDQNEEYSLQRGGSVSHRRAQSDSLQNRLPIMQHFGMSRPRRPVQRLRDTDNTRDPEDPWDSTVSESVSQTDSELQKDEEERDDSPLCDPEEMDLLGEIFDTLSLRSSHERGLLYGTRSLDLFGPDSHDYITKRCPGNPSQESLSLSISGSDSLHSWNLETTEEQSDLIEDSDALCLDTSLAEEEGMDDLHASWEIRQQDREQKEDREIQQEVNVAVNGKQEGKEMYDGDTLEEVKPEEGRITENEERNSSLEEAPGNDMMEQREEEGLKDHSKDKQCQSEEASAGQETQETQADKSKEVDNLLIKFIKPDIHHPKSVVEQQDQGEIAAILQQPDRLAVDVKPPAGQEKNSENTAKRQEQEVRHTSPSPKVRSAAERFQSEPSSKGFQIRPMAKILATQPHPPHDSERKKCSETPQEDDCPPRKVSELKKRFEA